MCAVTISLVIGYLLGCLNPALLVSRKKDTDLTKFGTGNLGATNTMLAFGMRYGVFVMVFDMFKAYLAVKMTTRLFPAAPLAGLAAGCASIVGHIFPFYLKFRGGKGLATFGGMILAYEPAMFPLLLIAGTVLAFLLDYAVALPISAAMFFPILVGLKTRSMIRFALTLSIGILIVIKHIENLERIRNGEEIRLKAYLKEKFHG